jgi:imidazole glycerol-phosphate synthase subunit HisF
VLRIRVIPIVLLDGYAVVKTIKFDVRRNLGNPITVARIYNTRDVDELVLLDIDAAKEHRRIDLFTIEDIASECFMPLTVGGGLRTCDDIAEVLAHGADKVVLNTILFENPFSIQDAVRIFGSQCIIISLDVINDGENNFSLFSHAGAVVPFSLDQAIQKCNEFNVGEILINSVDRDGTMTSYDFELIARVTGMTKIPVIVAGGAGAPEQCAQAVRCGASAVAAASIFHFTSITPHICKEAMNSAGIPVRLTIGQR